jgi:hypothetical protein
MWIFSSWKIKIVTVMITRPPRRRVMQVLPFKRSLRSSTHHHASWLRPLRYKLVMMDVVMNMIMKVKMIVTMMMNPLKDELIDMLEDAKEHFNIKRRKCKDLRKEIKALKQAFDELNASHERLEEAHGSLARLTRSLKKLIPLCLMRKMRRSIL